MELGDRIFYSVLSLILIGLFWLKFVEPLGLSIYWSLIVWAGMLIFLWYFKRPNNREKVK